MKLDTCNKLAEHIIQRANHYRNNGVIFAQLYADSDRKEHQQAYQKSCEIEKELRDLHVTVCQYLHKIEEELNVK